MDFIREVCTIYKRIDNDDYNNAYNDNAYNINDNDDNNVSI